MQPLLLLLMFPLQCSSQKNDTDEAKKRMIDTASSKSKRRPYAQTTNTRSDPSQIQQAGFITATDATMHNPNGAKLNDIHALKIDTNASPKRIDTTSHISHQPDRQETKKQNIEKYSRVYFIVKQSESSSSTVASPRTDRHVNSNTNSLPRDCPGVVSDTALHARTPKPASTRVSIRDFQSRLTRKIARSSQIHLWQLNPKQSTIASHTQVRLRHQ